MDFNALQHKLFALDPTDPAEDLRKLSESAGGAAQKNVQPTQDYVQESVEVAEGSLGLDKDYSVADFAALAGVTLTEAQKKGSAGQLKGKDSLDKLPAGTTKNATRDKLVGEDGFDPKGSFKAGWDDHNTLKAVGIENPIKNLEKSKSKPQADDKSAPKQAKSNDWKSFLKQHTSGLQAIAADPMKRKRFDTWMAKWNEDIEEGDGRKKGIHGKGHPMRKKQQAAIHAGESVESIKEMLMRKLEAKK